LTESGFRVLIGTGELYQRIEDLARVISDDYAGGTPHLVGVLRGAYQFTRDLSARLGVRHTVDFISVASYGSGTLSSGQVSLRQELADPVEGKDVLLVDDIVDTGHTLQWLLAHLEARRPRSVRTCCLLDKPSRRQVDVRTDYVGFPIDDVFVIGYGLDYQEKYRELPFISCLSPGHAA
jgi:hypoxanthine phosphoribosyltransferase